MRYITVKAVETFQARRAGIRPATAPLRMTFVCAGLVLFRLYSAGIALNADIETAIEDALTYRDSYFSAAGISRQARTEGVRTIADLNMLNERLQAAPDETNLWWCFLRGLTETMISRVNAARYFKKALTLARTDVGPTFALYVEFNRHDQSLWAGNALQQLEKQVLSMGAETVPAVFQQLLYDGIERERYSDAAQAVEYAGRAERFFHSSVWPSLRMLRRYWPAHPVRFLEECAGLALLAGGSWQVQLAAAYHLFQFFTFFCIMTAAIVGISLLVRYHSAVYHAVIELFPARSPRWLRAAVLGSLALVVLWCGILPALWVIYLVVWRHLGTKEKKAAVAMLLLVAATPLLWYVRESLNQSYSPQGAPVLFSRALYETPSPRLAESVAQLAQTDPDNHLLHTAQALIAMKKGEIALAERHIAAAERLKPDDQAVLPVAGMVYYFAGATLKAKKYFDRCAALHPRHAASVFNRGQCYLEVMETLDGMQLITDATELDPRGVNGFIGRNDNLFSPQWPPMRKFMMPDYTPGYFWRHIFIRGGWQPASVLWGNLFLGIAARESLIVFLFFILVLVAREFLRKNKGRMVTTVLYCELCGTAMCRSCGKGIICAGCHTALARQKDDKGRQNLRQIIILRRNTRKALIGVIIRSVFPGTGYFFGPQQKGPAASAVLIAATAMVYSIYARAGTFVFSVPSWAHAGMAAPLYAVCGLYSVIFLAKGVFDAVGILRTNEA